MGILPPLPVAPGDPVSAELPDGFRGWQETWSGPVASVHCPFPHFLSSSVR